MPTWGCVVQPMDPAYKEKFEQLPEEQQDKLRQDFNDIVIGQLQSFHKSLSFLHDTGQLTLKRNGIVRSNDRNIKNAEPLVSLNINHISDGVEASLHVIARVPV